jgi:hypothetical protein
LIVVPNAPRIRSYQGINPSPNAKTKETIAVSRFIARVMTVPSLGLELVAEMTRGKSGGTTSPVPALTCEHGERPQVYSRFTVNWIRSTFHETLDVDRHGVRSDFIVQLWTSSGHHCRVGRSLLDAG